LEASILDASHAAGVLVGQSSGMMKEKSSVMGLLTWSNRPEAGDEEAIVKLDVSRWRE